MKTGRDFVCGRADLRSAQCQSEIGTSTKTYCATVTTANSDARAMMPLPWSPLALSKRCTWPTCGMANPMRRASTSMRSGSRNEASSSCNARFSSCKRSTEAFWSSIRYPYWIELRLPHVEHHQCADNAHDRREKINLAPALVIGDLHQSGVIDLLCDIDLGDAGCHAAPVDDGDVLPGDRGAVERDCLCCCHVPPASTLLLPFASRGRLG